MRNEVVGVDGCDGDLGHTETSILLDPKRPDKKAQRLTLKMTIPNMMRKQIPTTMAKGKRYVLMSKGSSSVRITLTFGLTVQL